MWFTRQQFEICNQLRLNGLDPRFETGDLVARGFADLGYEEFQVLPGERLLSLTAGTISPLPTDHRDHFMWLPSIDEAIELIEQNGASLSEIERIDARQWRGTARSAGGDLRDVFGDGLYDLALEALKLVYIDKV
ncbi:MAG: hypothetical protein ACK5Y6_10255 [Pseudomonadota bacterium]|jgi:hypothetical protein